MPSSRLLKWMLPLAVLCSVAWATFAYSQQAGSGSSRSDPARATRPQTPEEFYDTFW